MDVVQESPLCTVRAEQFLDGGRLLDLGSEHCWVWVGANDATWAWGALIGGAIVATIIATTTVVTVISISLAKPTFAAAASEIATVTSAFTAMVTQAIPVTPVMVAATIVKAMVVALVPSTVTWIAIFTTTTAYPNVTSPLRL